MFKKYTFIFLVFCCLALFNIFTTPPKPTQAYGVIGEPCSIWYVDTHTPGWPFVESRWVESCPIDCFGDIAGDYHRPDVAWCEASVPPPNLPGIMLGEYCSAESSRTVQLNIMGTLGTHFEIEGPTGVFDATTYTFTTLAEGENQFRARAHNAGGSSEWTEWVTVAHDYSAPITTPQIVGLMGDNNWYTSPVTVSFMANDAQCFGVSQTVYEVNGISADYSGVPFTMDAEGVNTLTFHSTDGYHPETPQSASIQIDSLPPTLAITPDRPFDVSSGWWNAPISLHITSGDATSGVLTTEYNLNLAGWTAGDSVTLSADGVQELDAQVTDYAGHLTYDGVVIPIDSTAPALMVALSGEKGLLDWFITPPSLSIHATDATSGVLAILYQVDSGAQELYTSSLNFVREGLYTVQAFAVDVAQNITTQTFQVGYDITPPQTTATLTEIDGGMTVTLTGWDAVSGVKTIRMAINGVWGEYHHPVTVTGVGEYWVQYFSIDVAGHIESEKIAQFTIADTIQIVQAPPVVNIVPPANPPNTPPFETRDDFPPDLHNERVYFHSPPVSPPNTPPFETADDFPPNLHDENIYFHTPRIDRTDDGIKRNPRIILDEDLPFVQAVTPVISVNEDGTPNIIETLRELDAPQIIPPATIIPPVDTTSTTTTPLNGVLVTLATLGVITAGAGALTITATAIAKKKEQEAQQAQALADLQAQQTLQAQTASANWDENIQKQADALEAMIVAGKQSQANKNYWAAYAIWKSKVAEALARRRYLAFVATLTLMALLVGGSTITSKLDNAGYEKPISVAGVTPDKACSPETVSGSGSIMGICDISGGAGGGAIGAYIIWEIWQSVTCLFFNINCPQPQPNIGTIPNSPPQIQNPPFTYPNDDIDSIPIDRTIPIPWIDFNNPEPEEPDRIVRHYTTLEGYRRIRDGGWIMAVSEVRYEIQGMGIFFVDTTPFRGGYIRSLIAANLGIDYEKTACYIDISMNLLEDTFQGRWEERTTFNLSGITEYIFIAFFPFVAIRYSLVSHGSVFDLDPLMNPMERC